MIRNMAVAAALVALAGTVPAPQAAAQDALGGALIGGAIGGIVGGAATGRAGGAVAGDIIGGTAGAIIGAESERRRGGYYWHGGHGRCYVRHPSGGWVAVRRHHCH